MVSAIGEVTSTNSWGLSSGTRDTEPVSASQWERSPKPLAFYDMGAGCRSRVGAHGLPDRVTFGAWRTATLSAELSRRGKAGLAAGGNSIRSPEGPQDPDLPSEQRLGGQLGRLIHEYERVAAY